MQPGQVVPQRKYSVHTVSNGDIVLPTQTSQSGLWRGTPASSNRSTKMRCKASEAAASENCIYQIKQSVAAIAHQLVGALAHSF